MVLRLEAIHSDKNMSLGSVLCNGRLARVFTDPPPSNGVQDCLNAFKQGRRGVQRALDHRAPSKIPRTSGTPVKSARKGIRSVSSASWGSLNHDDTGTAL